MTPNWDAPELQVSSDTSWRAQYRALQSWYRQTQLHVPPGTKGNRLVGSMLPSSAAAGLNFLTPEIAAYVEKRIPEVQAENGTLEPDRLRHNMLSSMPLCFNLFGLLRQFPSATAEALSQLLGLNVAVVDRIEVEWAPPPAEHLNDRTAFDAFIEYRSQEGEKGFLGIETKYTEPFSAMPPKENPIYRRLTDTPGSGFKAGASERLMSSDTHQLWRNALLALSLRSKGQYAHGHVVVLACREDASAAKALRGVREQLVEPDNLVRGLALEDLVEAFKARSETSDWARRFEQRYLDLTPVSGS